MSEIIALLLPFVLIVGFAVFLTELQRRMPNPTVEKLEEIRLEEIRKELEGIRQTFERDPYAKR